MLGLITVILELQELDRIALRQSSCTYYDSTNYESKAMHTTAIQDARPKIVEWVWPGLEGVGRETRWIMWKAEFLEC